jgi:glycosyltransferase involved in cell wall biosynthesis
MVASAGMGKIIFVNRYFFPDHSATSQLVSDLAFELASQGHDIHVMTGGQLYTDPQASLVRRETIGGVQIYRLRTSRFGRARLWGRMLDYLTFYVGATWRLLHSIRPGDVVVAKTDPPMLSVCAALATVLKRGTLINWTQDLFPEVALAMGVPGVRRIAPVLKRLRNWSLRRARMTVVLGSLMAKRLRDEGVPHERISVIDNWADGDAIRPLSREDNPLAAGWQLEGKFVLGYSGNMGQVHEFKTVIDAAELLKAAEEIAFLFIGDGIARRWIEAEVEKRNLTNVRVRPYQPAEQLRLSLSLPDVHLISLQPALEGLIVPSKFYGIAAAGRPVIYVGDPDGEIPRVLRQEECGWSFPIGDVEPLSRWILTLAHNRQAVREAGLRARQVFDRQYARAHALRRWGTILGSVSAAGFPSKEKSAPERPVAVGEE